MSDYNVNITGFGEIAKKLQEKDIPATDRDLYNIFQITGEQNAKEYYNKITGGEGKGNFAVNANSGNGNIFESKMLPAAEVSVEDFAENISKAYDIEINDDVIEELSNMAAYDEFEDTISLKDLLAAQDSEFEAKMQTQETRDEIFSYLNYFIRIEEGILDYTVENNGAIAKTWDGAKNLLKFATGSDKTRETLWGYSAALEEAKDNPEKLTEMYKNITGHELDRAEFERFQNGQSDLSRSELKMTVDKYTNGQEMCSEIVSQVVSSIVASQCASVEKKALESKDVRYIIGAFAITAAASTAAYLIPQALEGFTEKDGYSKEEFQKDLIHGTINGVFNALTMGVMTAISSVGSNLAANAAAKGMSKTAQNGIKISTQLAAGQAGAHIMGDGITGATYLADAAMEGREVTAEEFAGVMLPTMAGATAAGFAGIGASALTKPVLTSGDSETKAVIGRLLSAGVSGGAAGSSAAFAAGGTSYFYNCTVNGKEVDMKEWLSSSNENVLQGALTGFASGATFEAVNIAAGTPAPKAAVEAKPGEKEYGLKSTQYFDKEGRLIAIDFKASDLEKIYGSAPKGENALRTVRISFEGMKPETIGFDWAGNDPVLLTPKNTPFDTVINPNNEYLQLESNSLLPAETADNLQGSMLPAKPGEEIFTNNNADINYQLNPPLTLNNLFADLKVPETNNTRKVSSAGINTDGEFANGMMLAKEPVIPEPAVSANSVKPARTGKTDVLNLKISVMVQKSQQNTQESAPQSPSDDFGFGLDFFNLDFGFSSEEKTIETWLNDEFGITSADFDADALEFVSKLDENIIKDFAEKPENKHFLPDLLTKSGKFADVDFNAISDNADFINLLNEENLYSKLENKNFLTDENFDAKGMTELFKTLKNIKISDKNTQGTSHSPLENMSIRMLRNILNCKNPAASAEFLETLSQTEITTVEGETYTFADIFEDNLVLNAVTSPHADYERISQLCKCISESGSQISKEDFGTIRWLCVNVSNSPISDVREYLDTYRYFDELVTDNGEKILTGRAGRMSDTEVILHMLNIDSGSVEASNVEMLLQLVKEGVVDKHVLEYIPSGGKLSSEVVGDIDKLYEAYTLGSDTEEMFVPTFDSASEAVSGGNETMSYKGTYKELGTGDVFQVKGEDFIRIKTSDTESQPLKLSKETYLKLFPPVERYGTTQNGIGNCWEISGINSLLCEPETRAKVLSLFSENETGVSVTYPNGQCGEINFPNGELPAAADKRLYSEGAPGVQLLEYAEGKEILAAKTPPPGGADTINTPSGITTGSVTDNESAMARDGGNSDSLYKLAGFNNAKAYHFENNILDLQEATRLLNDASTYDKYVVGWSSNGSGEGLLNSELGIFSGHAYRIKPAKVSPDGRVQTFKVINPWGIAETELTYDQMMQYGGSIYTAEK